LTSVSAGVFVLVMLAMKQNESTINRMSEIYTPEDAYRMHVQQVDGAEEEPTTPFMELSDMAIQGYEIAADMLNQLPSSESSVTEG
jgi:hypothetical protein